LSQKTPNWISFASSHLSARSSLARPSACEKWVVKSQNSSTGPRTAQGKQRSSLNALRHGLTGQTVVIPSDDHTAYDRFCRGFFDEYQPVAATEHQLVQTLADCAWRLNRLRAQEQTLQSLAALAQEPNIHIRDDRAAAACASGLAFQQQCKMLANLTLYEQRISRQFERAMKMLKEAQAERKENQEREMARAASLKADHDEFQAAEPRSVPYNPSGDGFVFSNGVIDAWIERKRRQEHARQADQRREKSATA
jgi:hypothetical protein